VSYFNSHHGYSFFIWKRYSRAPGIKILRGANKLLVKIMVTFSYFALIDAAESTLSIDAAESTLSIDAI
jgi:hypothetical protein